MLLVLHRNSSVRRVLNFKCLRGRCFSVDVVGSCIALCCFFSWTEPHLFVSLEFSSDPGAKLFSGEGVGRSPREGAMPIDPVDARMENR